MILHWIFVSNFSLVSNQLLSAMERIPSYLIKLIKTMILERLLGWLEFVRLDKFKAPTLIEGDDLEREMFWFQKIDCLINNEYSMSCFKTSDDMVYMPFNFIRRYFDIYGKFIKTSSKQEVFDWGCSYSKFYYPKAAYDYKSTYLWFDNDNVEVRDRSNLISGLEFHGRLGVDLQKACTILDKNLPIKIKNLHLSRILFKGKPLIDDVMLSSSAHESHLFSAARWLLENLVGQLKLFESFLICIPILILKPCWYPAMDQGQAATRVLCFFNMSSGKGGFRTSIFEYPTILSSFVLNGALWSEYFKEGLESSKHLLLLYDTGSGTLYDLRLFSLKTEPKIARWDYHTTHINQFFYLNTLLKDQQYQKDGFKRKKSCSQLK
uniref:D-glucuronyl C5-epimerase C-terminal domain-containing protein n=1 Tax=Tetranychus urticae TaxID=32264 RepID=T1KUX1_TETUR